MEASARNECRMDMAILCFVHDAPILHSALFEAISRYALIVREFLTIQNLNRTIVS
jgi:hypothetical protein